ncbi:hypothetical protein GBA52_019109 [Prunus armeniaca]|nr:hypothetical protein GBA52_019109 [Prunus armeniaca]
MDTKNGALDVCNNKTTRTDVVLNPQHDVGSTSTMQKYYVPSSNSSNATLGSYLARRLLQIGVTDPSLGSLTSAAATSSTPADGYARSRGVGACVVTFTVGGLSVLNAIAGAYGEDLPVICIVGGPNSSDYGADNRILHHTIGSPDFSQELRCFQNVTCYQTARFQNLEISNYRQLLLFPKPVDFLLFSDAVLFHNVVVSLHQPCLGPRKSVHRRYL